jgi:hypothetical protein
MINLIHNGAFSAQFVSDVLLNEFESARDATPLSSMDNSKGACRGHQGSVCLRDRISGQAPHYAPTEHLPCPNFLPTVILLARNTVETRPPNTDRIISS